MINSPSNVAVVAGSTATFSASADGYPPPAVQWQESTDDGSTWNDITGATSTTYTTPATTLTDSGELFRAVFTNVAGSITTTPAMLTVAASLPSWVEPGSAATWNGTKTLTVTGTAAIIADPGSEPPIVASGAAAVLTIQPPPSGSSTWAESRSRMVPASSSPAWVRRERTPTTT